MQSVECVPCNQKIPAIGDKSKIGLSNCTEGQLAGGLSTPRWLWSKNCNESAIAWPLSSTCSCCSAAEKKAMAKIAL